MKIEKFWGSPFFKWPYLPSTLTDFNVLHLVWKVIYQGLKLHLRNLEESWNFISKTPCFWNTLFLTLFSWNFFFQHQLRFKRQFCPFQIRSKKFGASIGLEVIAKILTPSPDFSIQNSRLFYFWVVFVWETL